MAPKLLISLAIIAFGAFEFIVLITSPSASKQFPADGVWRILWRSASRPGVLDTVKKQMGSFVWPFFTQILGRNFLSELCGEVHPETAPLQGSVLCDLLYRTEHFSRGRTGRKGAQQRGAKMASRGGKKGKRKKDAWKQVSCWWNWNSWEWKLEKEELGPQRLGGVRINPSFFWIRIVCPQKIREIQFWTFVRLKPCYGPSSSPSKRYVEDFLVTTFSEFLSQEKYLGVLSHHLHCEMKSPHLLDFSWDFADF